MQESLIHLSNKIGLKKPLTLPDYKAKSQYREKDKSIKNFFTNQEKKIVEDYFLREITLMEYKF